MRTTINDVDRRGGAHSTEDFNEILENACRILADTSAYLELKVEELLKIEAGTESAEDRKLLESQIKQTHAAWRQVLDIQAKSKRSTAYHPPLDMEAAREEILGRLARLTK